MTTFGSAILAIGAVIALGFALGESRARAEGLFLAGMVISLGASLAYLFGVI
jgi:hypothetical protein